MSTVSQDQNCIFCRIVNGELPSKIVYQDSEIVAFHDARPIAPVHILIAPIEHIESLLDVKDYSLIAKIHQVATKVARDLGISESGFRVTNNCGKEGGQTISHLHFHLLGGKQLKDMV